MIRTLMHCTAPVRATISLRSLRWAHSAPPLPCQPVPDLRKTLTRYLRSLQPLVDDDELESTRELVGDFLRPGGQGEELQRQLHKRAERTDNWLTDWRQECIYLENHLPLPVHSSPAVILPPQEYKDWRGQLRFASKLICGVLDFKAKIESPGGLEELWRGQRLCPDQYYKFFGSCREPGTKRDRVLLHPRSKSHHVTVCKNYQLEGPGLLPPRTPLTRVPSPRKLYFNFPPEIKQHIEQAKQNLDILVSDLDICCFSFPDFGKKFPQRYNMSPGTFLQTCLQLAYYRLHGSLCATNEGVSLRAYHRGRSDVVRCSSPEALEFVQAADDPQKLAEEKLSLLVRAVESQQEATEQVLEGQSVDGAILALRMLCLSSGMALPALFMDTSYAVSSHWKLFTGQVSSPLDCVMCYGPLVPDGYSVCFAPTQDSITVCVSAFHCCEETDAERLSDSLQGALRDVHSLLRSSRSEED
ncbi:LOW QUALITY PROTEIN: carnitine O-acetyltransferase-like [Anomaloglossus baeobatrachus]|uniref:LOW QUALITY PROTEIN: carnitine O-acetyltransferase-like n=1 Tax=Anomaloglossus baeobatrachus TaxID=238106 RepID=UPI003F507AD3